MFIVSWEENYVDDSNKEYENSLLSTRVKLKSFDSENDAFNFLKSKCLWNHCKIYKAELIFDHVAHEEELSREKEYKEYLRLKSKFNK